MKRRTPFVGLPMDEFEVEEPTKPETPETIAATIALLRTDPGRERPTVRDMRPLEVS